MGVEVLGRLLLVGRAEQGRIGSVGWWWLELRLELWEGGWCGLENLPVWYLGVIILRGTMSRMLSSSMGVACTHDQLRFPP